MHCPNCSTEIREGSLFCHQCGVLLETLKEFGGTKEGVESYQDYQSGNNSGPGDSLMRITFVASEMNSSVSRTFSHLTNMAKICVNEIRYDEANGIVEIPMKRREVIQRTRQGCIGLLLPPTISGYSWYDSLLTIRQVNRMKMDVDDRLVTECNSCFYAMMGLKIENDDMYLGSLEEASGKTLCDIFLTVNGYGLELVDHAQIVRCATSAFYTDIKTVRTAAQPPHGVRPGG